MATNRLMEIFLGGLGRFDEALAPLDGVMGEAPDIPIEGLSPETGGFVSTLRDVYKEAEADKRVLIGALEVDLGEALAEVGAFSQGEDLSGHVSGVDYGSFLKPDEDHFLGLSAVGETPTPEDNL